MPLQSPVYQSGRIIHWTSSDQPFNFIRLFLINFLPFLLKSWEQREHFALFHFEESNTLTFLFVRCEHYDLHCLHYYLRIYLHVYFQKQRMLLRDSVIIYIVSELGNSVNEKGLRIKLCRVSINANQVLHTCHPRLTVISLKLRLFVDAVHLHDEKRNEGFLRLNKWNWKENE